MTHHGMTKDNDDNVMRAPYHAAQGLETMGGKDATDAVKEIMTAFAERTGLSPPGPRPTDFSRSGLARG